MAELYVALVMRENMKDADGAYPDFAEAESCEDAIKAITSQTLSHPRWQAKSITRIVMADSLQNYLPRKLVAAEKETPRRRRRAKDEDGERERTDQEIRRIRRTRRKL